MFLFQDAGGEGFVGVGAFYGDSALDDDDAVVDLLVDEVDGAAGDLDAVVEGLVLGVESGEGGQERGVDIDDAVGVGLDESGRDDAHVACEADEVDLVLVKAGDELGVLGVAGAAGGGDAEGGEAQFAGGLEAFGVFAVGEDDGDFGAGDTVFADGLRDGEKI